MRIKQVILWGFTLYHVLPYVQLLTAVCVHFLPNARKERKCWAIVEDILQLIKAHHLCQETGRTGWLIIKLLWVTITAPIQQHKYAKKRHTHTNEATSSRGEKNPKGGLRKAVGQLCGIRPASESVGIDLPTLWNSKNSIPPLVMKARSNTPVQTSPVGVSVVWDLVTVA